jgi:hypothetical protein
VQRDIWAKEILKKEEKKEVIIEKYYDMQRKVKKEEWKDHYEKRDEKILKHNVEIKH